MCGIFAYLNYNVPRERRFILELLFNGLRRLEYRGYDSSGISIDSDDGPVETSSTHGSRRPPPPPLVFRQEGKIESLVRSVYQGIIMIKNQSLSSFWFLLYVFWREIDFHLVGMGLILLWNSKNCDFWGCIFFFFLCFIEEICP